MIAKRASFIPPELRATRTMGVVEMKNSEDGDETTEKDDHHENSQRGDAENQETNKGEEGVGACDDGLSLNGAAHNPGKPNDGLCGLFVEIAQAGEAQILDFASEAGHIHCDQKTEKEGEEHRERASSEGIEHGRGRTCAPGLPVV